MKKLPDEKFTDPMMFNYVAGKAIDLDVAGNGLPMITKKTKCPHCKKKQVVELYFEKGPEFVPVESSINCPSCNQRFFLKPDAVKSRKLVLVMVKLYSGQPRVAKEPQQ